MIADYIARTRATPFAWGRCDCCTWPADYIVERHGIDPMADLRGAYSTAFGARQIKIAQGGILGLWQDRLRFLPPGSDVVLATWRGAVIGGLMQDGFLMLKTGKDIMLTRKFSLIAGWSV